VVVVPVELDFPVITPTKLPREQYLTLLINEEKKVLLEGFAAKKTDFPSMRSITFVTSRFHDSPSPSPNS